jgi:hypothetical protein
VPEDKAEVAIARDEGATTIERLADLVCAGFVESAKVTVKLEVPLAVGMPSMRPVAGTRASPAGRLPAVMDQV